MAAIDPSASHVSPACGHKIHTHCARAWINAQPQQNKKTCPTCRAELCPECIVDVIDARAPVRRLGCCKYTLMLATIQTLYIEWADCDHASVSRLIAAVPAVLASLRNRNDMQSYVSETNIDATDILIFSDGRRKWSLPRGMPATHVAMLEAMLGPCKALAAEYANAADAERGRDMGMHSKGMHGRSIITCRHS